MYPLVRVPVLIELGLHFPYSYRAVPVWRNWQTRGTQNPVRGNSSVGSIPSTGTMFPLIFPLLGVVSL